MQKHVKDCTLFPTVKKKSYNWIPIVLPIFDDVLILFG